MSQQAGWYDDPQNPDDLRYWDGVQWTDHTSPKRKPGLDQAGQAAQSSWGQAPGQQQGQAPGQQPGQPAAGGQEPGNPWATGGTQPPFQGQQWQQPMPGGQQWQQPVGKTTPDGQPLAGWWHRVGARIIDGILIGVVGAALVPVLAPGYWEGLMDWSMSADDPFASLPAELADKQMRWALGVGVLGILYEVVMVTLLGGTVGKLITGLRIRLRDAPGHVGWVPSLLRALVYQGVSLLTQLSAALSFLGLFSLLNVLWPLWDEKNQALHDKVARTNVVRHR